MPIVTEEVENFLVNLGFKKNVKNNVSHSLFRHEVYEGIIIQDCRMTIKYPHIHLNKHMDFNPNCKHSIMQAYNHCIESYGKFKELCNIREEICSALRMDDYIKGIIEDYNTEQKYHK